MNRLAHALRPLVLLFTVAMLLGLAACGGSAPAPRSEPIAVDLATATFDTAWALIDRTIDSLEAGDLDWDAVGEELRPRARTTSSDSLRAVIAEMITRTGLSHYALIPRGAADVLEEMDASAGARDNRGGVGVETRVVGDEILVTGVESGSPAADAGLRTGWVIDQVGDVVFADVVEKLGDSLERRERDLRIWVLARALMDGSIGSEVTLHARDGADTTHELTLTRVEKPGTMNKFGHLPPTNTRLVHRWIEHGGERYGYIHFNIWLVPIAAQFQEAIDIYREADGLIVDLRGNLGGIAGLAMGLAGHVMDEQLPLGVMSSGATVLNLRVNPQRVNKAGERVTPYAGPLAILQDELSISTSEFFAGGLQYHGRAHVFGSASGGQALPSRLVTLPNGDVLQYAFADYVDPGGARLEGRGVIPDTPVAVKRADLLAGRDAPLEAALAWIAAQNR